MKMAECLWRIVPRSAMPTKPASCIIKGRMEITRSCVERSTREGLCSSRESPVSRWGGKICRLNLKRGGGSEYLYYLNII